MPFNKTFILIHHTDFGLPDKGATVATQMNPIIQLEEKREPKCSGQKWISCTEHLSWISRQNAGKPVLSPCVLLNAFSAPCSLWNPNGAHSYNCGIFGLIYSIISRGQVLNVSTKIFLQRWFRRWTGQSIVKEGFTQWLKVCPWMGGKLGS